MWAQRCKTNADQYCWCRQWIQPPIQWSLCHHHRCSPTSFCLTRPGAQRWTCQTSALLPQVDQNDHSATIVSPISMPLPAPSYPEHINITAINIDALTEACTTVTIPAEIGPNQCGSLRCKINSGASDNVMPLCVSAKLFTRCITTDGKQTRLHPCDTRLMVYSGSNIPQFGTLDTAIEWTPKGHQCSKHLQTSSDEVPLYFKFNCSSQSISNVCMRYYLIDPGHKLIWCLLKLLSNGFEVIYSYLRSDFCIQSWLKVS